TGLSTTFLQSSLTKSLVCFCTQASLMSGIQMRLAGLQSVGCWEPERMSAMLSPEPSAFVSTKIGWPDFGFAPLQFKVLVRASSHAWFSLPYRMLICSAFGAACG